MDRILLKDKTFELFIPAREIQQAVDRIASQISHDVGQQQPLFVGILNGAFMFIADLMQRLNGPYELTFARYASYQGDSATGTLREIMPVKPPVAGRSVILIEDIVDTGFTMHCLIDKFRREGATDVKLATMLFKPDALKYDLKPDYVGLIVPNKFVVGYGLDYDGLGRTYRDIYKACE